MPIITIFAVGCLPKELGNLANSTFLDVSDNRLTGQLSIRSERLRVLLIFTFSTGELPKQLGQLTKLTHLDVSDNELTGALSTRSERLNGCNTRTSHVQESCHSRSFA